MAYRDNVTQLANHYGISNDPGLREEDLQISELQFVLSDNETTTIVATHMNRGGRLFFQELADRWGLTKEIIIDSDVLRNARKYFAELWEPDPVPGKRKLLDALRRSMKVKLIWKDGRHLA